MHSSAFTNTLETEKLFWKTLRKNVHEYFEQQKVSPKSNTQMVVKSFVIILAYILPWLSIMFLPTSIWLALLGVVIMGFAKAGIGMSIMHDGLHGAYSKKKWVNKLTGSTMYLIGSNVFNWKIQHNIYHHAYTNIEGLDEDIQTRWIIRLSEHTPTKPIHQYQHIYAFVLYGLMTFSMLFGDIKQLIQYNKTGITKKHKANSSKELFIMIIVKTTYLLMMLAIPIMFTNYSILQVFVGFFIMHWIAGFILSIVFQMAHIVEGALQLDQDSHQHEWAVHQLLTTANFAPKNKLLNWYVGGLNFQIEHHLFPHICHIHYTNLSSIVSQTAAEYGIPYNIKPTLGSAVHSHYMRLKELGRSPIR